MLLKSLSIQNIRSYNNQTISFPKGSTLLSGDIGSGKTTILLAIEFALFGIQPTQKATSLLKTGETEAEVKLEFEVDNKEVIIERKLKRGKKSTTQDYVAITIDNQKYEESITEIKSRILSLLNYPQEFSKKTNLLYKFTVYTPQEEMKQIIQEAGEIRLDTLRHVFGIDKYKRIQENLSLLTSKLREKTRMNQILFQDLEELLINLKSKQINLEKNKSSLTQSENELNKAIKKREEKENEIQSLKEKIEEKRNLESEKSKHNVIINEKNSQINGVKNNIIELTKQLEESKEITFSKEEYNSLTERINFQEKKEKELQDEYMDLIGKIKSFENKKTEAENLIRKLTGLEKCPTCLQQVTQEYKDGMSTNANNELTKIHNSTIEFNKRKELLIEKIQFSKKSKKDFEEKKKQLELTKIKLESLRDKEERIKDFEEQKEILEKEIALLKNKINIIENSIKEYDKYTQLFEGKELELKEAKKTENSLIIKKVEIKKEIQFSDQQILETKEKIENKQKIKTQNEKIKELESWLSNKFTEIITFTEKQVMITLKDEFSKLFSRWFSILVSENLSATLTDDFSPMITQQDYELEYSFLSGGERTAIALAYRLALNQIINSLLSNIKTSNLVILDEPTDGFSAQQLEKMRDVLDQLDIEQLILVSHEQKMEDFVDNIIKIKKVDGVSGIEG
jgi:exonuclease SbcC